MNLLADESIDQQIVEALRIDGHDVVYIAELSPSFSDDDVLNEAGKRSALLLTADKDFGELLFRQGRMHEGVMLIRLAGLTPKTKADLVCRAISQHNQELGGSFCVVSAGLVRIRRAP